MSTQMLLIIGGIVVLFLVGWMAFLFITSRRGAGKPTQALWPPTFFMPERLPKGDSTTRAMPAGRRPANDRAAADPADSLADFADVPTAPIRRPVGHTEKPAETDDTADDYPTNPNRADVVNQPDSERTARVPRKPGS